MGPQLTGEDLAVTNNKRVIFLILDGLGDLPLKADGPTALEAAGTPNFDALLPQSCLGQFDPVEPGITPGSGPGHLALFGYDPREWPIGRGVLEALGIDFELEGADVASRFNFCTLDKNRNITDRRAGRIDSETNRRLVDKINANITPPGGVTCFIRSVSEHRGMLVVRGEGFGGKLPDTDPQQLGVPPLDPTGADEPSKRTAAIVADIVGQAEAILADEPKANGLLFRGFDTRPNIPSMADRFKIKPGAIATYPMYRGVARLVGMDVLDPPPDVPQTVARPASVDRSYDYLFVHIKYTDKAGEDGDFDRKVAVIEEVDRHLPELMKGEPDVLVVTGDHSTPARLKAHSWHPVPALLYAPATVRSDRSQTFDERHCARGGMGRLPMKYLVQIALAHAEKIAKFGA